MLERIMLILNKACQTKKTMRGQSCFLIMPKPAKQAATWVIPVPVHIWGYYVAELFQKYLENLKMSRNIRFVAFLPLAQVFFSLLSPSTARKV